MADARRPAQAGKKVAPRTKGTPKVPPKPRKAAAPAKSKAAAKAPASSTRLPPRRTAPPGDPATVPAAAARPASPAAVAAQPVAPAPVWLPAPGPSTIRPFDPATGAWLPATGPPAPVEEDPAAYKRGATRTILSNVLLGLGLAFMALNFIAALVTGAVLIFAPDSDLADALGGEGYSSPAAVITIALLTFLVVGVIPFVWVLGTRVRPWRGAVRFLNLRARFKDIALGVLLVLPMILGVYILIVTYVCVVDGCGALDDPAQDEEDLSGLLKNLTWAVVIIVPLCAGIGEEIFFRGVLQRWVGVWGQAALFGLAHAGNGFLPQILFAFLLGVAFGYLYRRGWSLVTLIIAHTLYDFVLLAMALLYPELG